MRKKNPWNQGKRSEIFTFKATDMFLSGKIGQNEFFNDFSSREKQILSFQVCKT